MAYSFRRGVRAMTVTSSTTAVAFFANAFSEIMPIRSFGIFTGVLIPINFLLVVMIMPPAVIYHERVIMKKSACCGACGKKKEEEEKPEKEINKIEEFFDGPFNNFVFKFRWVIAITTVVWAVVSFIFAPQMGPQTE